VQAHFEEQLCVFYELESSGKQLVEGKLLLASGGEACVGRDGDEGTICGVAVDDSGEEGVVVHGGEIEEGGD